MKMTEVALILLNTQERQACDLTLEVHYREVSYSNLVTRLKQA